VPIVCVGGKVNSNARSFLEYVVEHNRDKIVSPIYEFGSYRCYGDPIENLRDIFPDMEYHGCDIREGAGVDEIRDIMLPKLRKSSAGMVICIDTLEHVKDPWKAVKSVEYILKTGGIFVLTSVFNFPIHDHPYDYWRFTPEIFREFFSNYSFSEINAQGGEDDNPTYVMGWGIK
jgi:hypothetical protein